MAASKLASVFSGKREEACSALWTATQVKKRHGRERSHHTLRGGPSTRA